MVRALVLALLVALGSGCGQAMVDNPTPAAERETTRVTLYFLAEGGTIALGVRRDIVQRTPPPWGLGCRRSAGSAHCRADHRGDVHRTDDGNSRRHTADLTPLARRGRDRCRRQPFRARRRGRRDRSSACDHSNCSVARRHLALERREDLAPGERRALGDVSDRRGRVRRSVRLLEHQLPCRSFVRWD